MRFSLKRYIQQYVKIFTEEGRRAVNIKHTLIEKLVNVQNNDLKATDSNNTNPNPNIPSSFNSTLSYSNSTLKKPVNTSPAISGIPFQKFFENSKISVSDLRNTYRIYDKAI